MSKRKVFTEEELREMGVPTAQLIQAAIDADDKVKAKELTQRMYRESLILHDLYLDWITGLLTFIGRRYGDGVLEEALREGCAASTIRNPFSQEWERCEQEGDLCGKAELMAMTLRQHLMPVKIEEDEEKFILEMQPCGSGGRQVLNGLYEPPINFLKVEKPQPMTYGRKDFPVYCCHGAIFHMMAIESAGAPMVWEEPSDKLGEEPCKFYLYKDSQALPAEFYAKVGKKKGNPQA
jgi:hypothetical protein